MDSFLGPVFLVLLMAAAAFVGIMLAQRGDAKRNAQWLKDRDAARKDMIEKYLMEHGIDFPVPPPMRYIRDWGGEVKVTPDDVLIAEVKAKMKMSEYPPDLDATCARMLDAEQEPLHIAEAEWPAHPSPPKTSAEFKKQFMTEPVKRTPTKDERRAMKAEARRRQDDDLSVPTATYPMIGHVEVILSQPVVGDVDSILSVGDPE